MAGGAALTLKEPVSPRVHRGVYTFRNVEGTTMKRKQKHVKLSIEELETRTLLTADLTGVLSALGVRSIEGTGNNLLHPTWGSAGTDRLRTAPAAYADGHSAPAGSNRPSAREISNVIVDQGDEDVISDRNLSA